MNRSPVDWQSFVSKVHCSVPNLQQGPTNKGVDMVQTISPARKLNMHIIWFLRLDIEELGLKLVGAILDCNFGESTIDSSLVIFVINILNIVRDDERIPTPSSNHRGR